MKLARLGPPGQEVPVLLDGDRRLDLRPVVDDLHPGTLGPAALQRIRDAHAGGGLAVLDGADDLRTGSPIARPGTIVCIGQNYAAHAAESGAQPPAEPIVFLKAASTVAGPFDDVPVPRGSERTDWEVELGVVIGTAALYLDSPEAAADHVAGYVLANDLSEREFQLDRSGGQWSKGKCCPGFLPLGPWLVTPDEVDATDVRLSSRVNGEGRQDSTTADMLFGVDFLVWHLSQFMRLDPGDVILTGTPEGVALSGRFPYLRAGDVVEVEIDGLGVQRQTMVTA